MWRPHIGQEGQGTPSEHLPAPTAGRQGVCSAQPLAGDAGPRAVPRCKLPEPPQQSRRQHAHRLSPLCYGSGGKNASLLPPTEAAMSHVEQSMFLAVLGGALAQWGPWFLLPAAPGPLTGPASRAPALPTTRHCTDPEGFLCARRAETRKDGSCPGRTPARIGGDGPRRAWLPGEHRVAGAEAGREDGAEPRPAGAGWWSCTQTKGRI